MTLYQKIYICLKFTLMVIHISVIVSGTYFLFQNLPEQKGISWLEVEVSVLITTLSSQARHIPTPNIFYYLDIYFICIVSPAIHC